MAKELKDLQSLIEEKANKRLHDDFIAATKHIRDSRLFNESIFGVKKEGLDTEFTTAYWAFLDNDNRTSYFSLIKEKWLPVYIEEEAANFMQEVERLRLDVDNLVGSNYQEY